VPPEEGSGEVAAPDTEPQAWSYLSELAADGKLLIHDDGIAYECATLCAEFMGMVEAVGQEGLFDGAAPLSRSCPAPLGSLNALDEMLTGLGTQLSDCIGSPAEAGTYLGALNGMLETLKAAGKKYQETDDSSADEFDMDSVKSPSPIDMTLASHSGETFSSKFHLERLKNAEFTTVAGLDPEDPASVFYTTLYSLGDYIRTFGLAGLYESKGTKWFRFGDSLQDAKVEFNNNLVGITANSWDGEGRSGAVAASVEFGKQLDSLVEAVWRVADAYRFAALWLASTEEAMPKTPEYYGGNYRKADEGAPAPLAYEGYGSYEDLQNIRDRGDHVVSTEVTYTHDDPNDPYGYFTETITIVEDPTPYYQEKFKDAYIAGITETDQYFPKLPSYTPGTDPSATEETPVEPLPGPEIPAGPEVPGGDTPGGGGAITPGTPSAEEQLRKLQSLEDAAAKEQAAREQAAQDLAERQSQQQMAQQAMQALQQGLGTVQQAVQDAARQSLENAMPPGGLPTAGLPPGLDPSKTAGLPGLGAGGPGGAPSNAGKAPGAARPSIDTTRLFPRAGMPGTSTPMAGIGGQQASGMPAGGSPMGGAPMGGGGGAPGGGGRGQGDDKHERAKYLDRADNIDEGLGDSVDMSRPVVGETGNRPPAEQPQQPVVHRQRPVPAPAPAPARPSRSEDRVTLPGREGA
jgi:hypothetical protein